MRNLPFPVRVPKDCELQITQKYGNTTLNEWYRANGVTAPSHNGVDLVLAYKGKEDAKITYGAAFVTPSPDWSIAKTTFDTAMSTKGNGVTLESPEFFENGLRRKIQIVGWHLSEVEYKKGILPSFTVVGYLGNSGVVRPQPSPSKPYDGSHLHFMMFEYTYKYGSFVLDNANNGQNGAVDPLARFSISEKITGEDTEPQKDLPPLYYFLAYVQRLLSILKPQSRVV